MQNSSKVTTHGHNNIMASSQKLIRESQIHEDIELKRKEDEYERQTTLLKNQYERERRLVEQKVRELAMC